MWELAMQLALKKTLTFASVFFLVRSKCFGGKALDRGERCATSMCSFASKQRKIDGAYTDEYPEDTLKILKHEEFTVH